MMVGVASLDYFGVTIEGDSVSIADISINGNKVYLDLNQTVGKSQDVKVNYIDQSNSDDQDILEDVSGNDAPEITDNPVVNNSNKIPPTIDGFSLSEKSSQERIYDLFELIVATPQAESIDYVEVILVNNNEVQPQYRSIVFGNDEIDNSTGQHKAIRNSSILTHGLWLIDEVKVQNFVCSTYCLSQF